MTTKGKKIASAVAGAALAMAATQSAHAALIIDYRFSSLSTDTTKFLSAGDVGTDVTVHVFATVTGTGLDGVAQATFRAFSQQVSGGAFTGAGSGANNASFAANSMFNNLAQAGVGQDLNADSINDLAGVASGGISANDPKARSQLAPSQLPSPGGIGYYSNQGSWTSTSGPNTSIELGTFTVHIGTLTAGGTTKFNVGLPTAASAASWFENATTNNGTGAKAAGVGGFVYSVGSSVSFVVTVTPSGVYKYALTTNNDATLGTLNSKSLAVSGNNGKYADPGPDSNYVPANGSLADYAVANNNLGVGAELPVLVLVDFDLGTSGKTIDQLEAALTSAGDVAATKIVGPNDVDADGQRALLLGQYPTFTGATSVLFEFATAPGATAGGLHWGFDLSGTGASVNRTIIVPEPASVGLLALGGLGLLSRRRNKKA